MKKTENVSCIGNPNMCIYIYRFSRACIYKEVAVKCTPELRLVSLLMPVEWRDGVAKVSIIIWRVVLCTHLTNGCHNCILGNYTIQ